MSPTQEQRREQKQKRTKFLSHVPESVPLNDRIRLLQQGSRSGPPVAHLLGWEGLGGVWGVGVGLFFLFTSWQRRRPRLSRLCSRDADKQGGPAKFAGPLIKCGSVLIWDEWDYCTALPSICSSIQPPSSISHPSAGRLGHSHTCSHTPLLFYFPGLIIFALFIHHLASFFIKQHVFYFLI